MRDYTSCVPVFLQWKLGEDGIRIKDAWDNLRNNVRHQDSGCCGGNTFTADAHQVHPGHPRQKQINLIVIRPNQSACGNQCHPKSQGQNVRTITLNLRPTQDSHQGWVVGKTNSHVRQALSQNGDMLISLKSPYQDNKWGILSGELPDHHAPLTEAIVISIMLWLSQQYLQS